MIRSISLSFALVLALLSFFSCHKDTEVAVQGMDLLKLESDSINMLAGDTVRGIPNNFNIVATFSNDINFGSITRKNITIVHDTTHLVLNYIIDGKALYIAPATILLAGARLTLTLGDSLNPVTSLNGFQFPGRIIHFITAGVGVDTPPLSDHQLMYVQFNGNFNDLTQRDSVVSASAGFTVDRFGIASQAGNFVTPTTPGTGNIVEYQGRNLKPPIPPLISPSITISTWINIANLDYRNDTIPSRSIFGLAGESGYYFQITGSASGPVDLTIVTDHLSEGNYVSSKNVYGYTGTEPDSIPYALSNLLTDGWHHLVFTYNDSTAKKTLYIDSNVIPVRTSDRILVPVAPMFLDARNTTGLDTKFAIGYACSKANTASRIFNYITASDTFAGALDDLRVFDIALTVSDVQALYLNEKPVD